MNIRVRFCLLIGLIVLFEASCARAPAGSSHMLSIATCWKSPSRSWKQLYRNHKYTVTDVVRWHIARIEKIQRDLSRHAEFR